MGPEELEADALAGRAEELAAERATAMRLVMAFGQLYARIRDEALALLAGQPTRRQLSLFADGVGRDVGGFAAQAGAEVVSSQREATTRAVGRLTALLPGLRRPDGAMLDDLVARMEPGQPLFRLFAAMGPQTATAARQAIAGGMRAGENPRAIASDLRRACGVPLDRALVISRTEVLRSYRNATLATLRANPELVAGWRWVAALDRRTCAFCIAQHGTVHALGEPFATHPCCRCAIGPVLVGQEEMQGETGAAWFARQGNETRQAILGPAKLAALDAGEFTLLDIAGRRTHRIWGATGYERSLVELRAVANGGFFATPPRLFSVSGGIGGGQPPAGGGGASGGAPPPRHPVTRLILSIADSGRAATATEIATIRQYVASVGFHTAANRIATASEIGHTVNGRTIRRGDVLTNAESHYIKHVLIQREWPPGTTERQYEASLRAVVLDPAGGVLLDRSRNTWYLSFFSRSGAEQGPLGHGWIMVGFNTRPQRWMTGFQPTAGVLYAFTRTGRTDRRWLQRPR